MANVLVIGGGGREHALAWALSRSPQVEQVYVAPGNGGTSWPAQSGAGLLPRAAAQNVNIDLSKPANAAAWALENAIDLTVIGPEQYLAAGMVDKFREFDLAVFGPTQGAAQIEASKAFAKDIMTQQGIPTGEYFVTDDYYAARRFLEEFHKPVVVKADGLAAGKGVFVTHSREEAGMAIHRLMVKREFGDAGAVVVLEELLEGREVSVLAFSDGKTVKPMLLVRDHKRALNDDKGLNTGGMGAVAPVHDISQEWVDTITQQILQPAIDGLAALGTPFVGVLYAGLMITPYGPRVLEFNARFGDPETQVLLPLLQTDLYEILQACVAGTLDQTDITWQDAAAACVVLASAGYPENYPKGLAISGADVVASNEANADVILFHAGTTRQDGQLLTNGGRVLNVTAVGADLDEALRRAYDGVYAVQFEGMHYRTDIGKLKIQG